MVYWSMRSVGEGVSDPYLGYRYRIGRVAGEVKKSGGCLPDPPLQTNRKLIKSVIYNFEKRAANLILM